MIPEYSKQPNKALTFEGNVNLRYYNSTPVWLGIAQLLIMVSFQPLYQSLASNL